MPTILFRKWSVVANCFFDKLMLLLQFLLLLPLRGNDFYKNYEHTHNEASLLVCKNHLRIYYGLNIYLNQLLIYDLETE